jgi:hypothetical protein
MNDSQKLKLIVERLPGMQQAARSAISATSVFIGRQANDPVLPIIQAIKQVKDDLDYCQVIAAEPDDDPLAIGKRAKVINRERVFFGDVGIIVAINSGFRPYRLQFGNNVRGYEADELEPQP